MTFSIREAKKQVYMYAALFALSQSITYILYSVAFKYGSYLVLQGEMTPSAVYRSVLTKQHLFS